MGSFRRSRESARPSSSGGNLGPPLCRRVDAGVEQDQLLQRSGQGNGFFDRPSDTPADEFLIFRRFCRYVDDDPNEDIGSAVTLVHGYDPRLGQFNTVGHRAANRDQRPFDSATDHLTGHLTLSCACAYCESPQAASREIDAIVTSPNSQRLYLEATAMIP
jgi:hypothetical protein